MYVSIIGKCCQSKLKERNSLVNTMWTKFDPEVSSASLCMWTMKAGTVACFSPERKLHAPDLPHCPKSTHKEGLLILHHTSYLSVTGTANYVI